MSKQITPFLVGSGSAGKAMAKSLAMVKILYPEVPLAPLVALQRGESLAEAAKAEMPLLLIANPHGLHTKYLLEAKRAAIQHVVVEKPAVVRLDEIDALAGVGTSVSVCHGYRQMWGPRTVASWLREGKLGELIGIEGRYWQSSTAARALSGGAKDSWKNDRALGGDHDVLIDLGAHWVDLVLFLKPQAPDKVDRWLSYANAEAAHRDSHVHLTMEWKTGQRAFASISKNWHGAGNDLELHVLGTRGRASWKFQEPDVVVLGTGAESRVVARTSSSETPSEQGPFHGLGWLEGYTDILKNKVFEMCGMESQPVPTLEEHLKVMRVLLGRY